MTIRHRCGCGDRPSAGFRRWGFVLLLAVLLAGASPRMAEAQVQASDNARQITVDEAVEIALRRNPRLIQAYSTIEMAEHNRLSAYGALLPGVNAFFQLLELVHRSSRRAQPGDRRDELLHAGSRPTTRCSTAGAVSRT